MAIAARVKTTIMTGLFAAERHECLGCTNGIRPASICSVLGFCAGITTVRTTIDVPETLFRRIKALAALRGSSVKDLIAQAIEHEVTRGSGVLVGQAVAKPVRVPLIHLRRGQKLDLTGFDLDDLLT
jgi:hypothetical protein